MLTSPPQYLTGDKAAIEAFLDRFDVFLFDCDGVIWSGEHVFPGTAETIDMLRKSGKQVVFVTNNSSKSRAEYKKKFDHLNIPCNVDEVFGSSYSAAVYISRILRLDAPNNKVFVFGSSGIEAELKAENVLYCGGTDPSLCREMRPEDYISIADGTALDENVGVVLAGMDAHMTYLKFSLGLAYLRRGAVFLATNIDTTFPTAGALFPGAGSIMAPFAKALGREPLSLGKPSQAMMDAIEGKFKFDRSRACMVGDRLDTDIQFGIEGKLGGTLAVLTGVSKRNDFLTPDAPIVPSAYIDKLGDLLG